MVYNHKDAKSVTSNIKRKLNERDKNKYTPITHLKTVTCLNSFCCLLLTLYRFRTLICVFIVDFGQVNVSNK